MPEVIAERLRDIVSRQAAANPLGNLKTVLTAPVIVYQFVPILQSHLKPPYWKMVVLSFCK